MMTKETNSPILIDNSVLPKMDAEPVVLSTYFAIQALRGENYIDVAKAVLEAAEQQQILFRKLQVLDVTAIGGTQFIRFRSDVPSAALILQSMSSRSYVMSDPETGNYRVNFVGGRTGKYPASTMCTPPKVGFGRIFAGPRIRKWRSQFER